MLHVSACYFLLLIAIIYLLSLLTYHKCDTYWTFCDIKFKLKYKILLLKGVYFLSNVINELFLQLIMLIIIIYMLSSLLSMFN